MTVARLIAETILLDLDRCVSRAEQIQVLEQVAASKEALDMRARRAQELFSAASR